MMRQQPDHYPQILWPAFQKSNFQSFRLNDRNGDWHVLLAVSENLFHDIFSLKGESV